MNLTILTYLLLLGSITVKQKQRNRFSTRNIFSFKENDIFVSHIDRFETNGNFIISNGSQSKKRTCNNVLFNSEQRARVVRGLNMVGISCPFTLIMASASPSLLPTFPGNMTRGRPGHRLSCDIDHTGTPGRIWPITCCGDSVDYRK